LQGDILPAAEGPAHRGHDFPHLGLRQHQGVGDLADVVVGPLGGTDQGDPPFFVYVGQSGLRLEVGVLHAVGPIFFLHHHVGLGKAGVVVAVADVDLLDQVRSPLRVHQGGVWLQGCFRVGDGRKSLDLHPHPPASLLGHLFRLGHHQGNGVAHPVY